MFINVIHIHKLMHLKMHNVKLKIINDNVYDF